MPNWTNNNLIVAGEESLVQDFFKKHEHLNFNDIISRDEFVKEKKKDWDKLSDKEKTEQWRNDFVLYEFNNGGYQWNVTHWGTKWNILKDDGKGHNNGTHIKYMFNTAWAPPVPIIHKLIQMYPKLNFDFNYSEPGMGFGGEIIAEQGEILVDEQYNTIQYECPECEYWGEERDRGERNPEIRCEDCGHTFIYRSEIESESGSVNDTNVSKLNYG